MRKIGTNIYGNNFSLKEVLAVWNKAAFTDDSNIRYDVCGTEIHFDKYGNTNSQYGWEIDHIQPVSKGGGDELSNLQPLHWNTNRVKGDSWLLDPKSYCHL